MECRLRDYFIQKIKFAVEGPKKYELTMNTWLVNSLPF